MSVKRALILALVFFGYSVEKAVAQTPNYAQPCWIYGQPVQFCAAGNYAVTLDIPWLPLSGNGTLNPTLGWKIKLVGTNASNNVVDIRYDFMSTDGIHHQTVLAGEVTPDGIAYPTIMVSGDDQNASPGQSYTQNVISPADFNNNPINGTIGGSIVATIYSSDQAAINAIAAMNGGMVRQQARYYVSGPNGPTPIWLVESTPTLRQLETSRQWDYPIVISPASTRSGSNGSITDFAIKNPTANTVAVSIWLTDANGITQAGCSVQDIVVPGGANGHQTQDLFPESCFPEPNGLVGQLHIKPLNGGIILPWVLQLVGSSGTGVNPF